MSYQGATPEGLTQQPECHVPASRPWWVLCLLSLVVSVSVWAAPIGTATTGLQLSSPAPGELILTWTAPAPAPSDYRVNWAKADAAFPSWKETEGNAFPTTTTLTLTDLEAGLEYKVRVRARYAAGHAQGQGASPWSTAVVQRIDDYRADTTTVGTITVGEEEAGYIESVGDEDWYFLDLEAAQDYVFTIEDEAAQLLGIYDAAGSAVSAGVSRDEDGGGLTFTPETTGLYHLAVGGVAAATGSYTVTVVEAAPAPEPESDAHREEPDTAQGEEPDTTPPAPREVWSHTLEVAEVRYGGHTPIVFHGFGAYATPPSAPWVIELPGGAVIRVQALVVRDRGTPLYWAVEAPLSPALHGQLSLRLGTQTFRFAEARRIAATPRGHFYFWDSPGLQWQTGDRVEAALSYEAEAQAVDLLEVPYPGRVQAVTLTTGSLAGTLETAWQAPANAAAADIEAYEVYVQAVGGDWRGAQRQVVDGASRRATLEGLVPSGEYEVQVYAVNAAAVSGVARGAGSALAGAAPANVSEAAGEDLPHSTATTGRVAVGGSVTGEIESRLDQDWFAVELTLGHTYVIDHRGVSSGGGTLIDPFLMGLYDTQGRHIGGTTAPDGGKEIDSRLTYMAAYSGIHYVSAAGNGDTATGTGTYTVSVTDTTPAMDDSDRTRTGATDLGDLTEQAGAQERQDQIGGPDRIDYFRFTLSAPRTVEIELGGLSRNADLFVEDAEDNVLGSGETAGTADETVSLTLLSGTYYVRVAAIDLGDNAYTLRYGLQAVPTANLLVDTNRDGVVDSSDEEGEDTWDTASGAVFGPNADDDDNDGIRDGWDDRANGEADLLDMTPVIVRQMSRLESNHSVVLEMDYVSSSGGPQLFYERTDGEIELLIGDGDSERRAELPLAQLVAGDLQLYIDSRWGRYSGFDGQLSLTLTVEEAGIQVSQDTVALRGSPILFSHHLQPAERVFVMNVPRGEFTSNTALLDALNTHLPASTELYELDYRQYETDRWIQDSMQTSYVQRPSASGVETATVHTQLHRDYGRLQFFLPDELLGPDTGYVYPGGEDFSLIVSVATWRSFRRIRTTVRPGRLGAS